MKLNSKQYSDKGDPLLVLHGLFGSLGNLGWQSRELSKDFAVTGLDLRNHGASPHSDIMTYPSMAQDVLEYMDDNGIDSSHLLGHSMGGKVAMQVALMAPERVNRLVVADIAPVRYEKGEHGTIFEGLNAIDLNAVQSRREAESVLAEYEGDEMVRQFLLTNLAKNSDGHFYWRINLSALQSNYQALREKPESSGSFYGPVLFIKGADSSYIQEKHRDEIMTMFPNASMKVIMQTGHWLHAEKPQTFFRIAYDFLSKN
jgi:esterase